MQSLASVQLLVVGFGLSHAQFYQSHAQNYASYDHDSHGQHYDYDSTAPAYLGSAVSNYFGDKQYNSNQQNSRPAQGGPFNGLFGAVNGKVSNFFEPIRQLGLPGGLEALIGAFLGLVAIAVLLTAVTAPFAGSGRELDVGDWDTRHSVWLQQTHFAEENLALGAIADEKEETGFLV